MKKLKIDIVSDVVCPWCAIGYKRLERAIDELGVQDKVEIEWQPFELNEQMPAEGEDINDHIQRKYGTPPEERKRMKENMAFLMDGYNFNFDYYDGMRMPNTVDAHILIEYAKENNKQTEMNMRFMKAHFSERKNLASQEVLLQEIENMGLDVNEAKARLSSNERKGEVKQQEEVWKSHGISSVPTMVFNRTSALTGAQSVDIYKQVLSELINKNQP